MDVRVLHTERPIYVDLDGALIKTDLFWESLFLFARQSPDELWRLPFWAMAGRGTLKAELAERIDLCPSLLPYRAEVVEVLRRDRLSGRRIVLTSGADERLAQGVAEHLGLFDAVIASSRQADLTAEAKFARVHADSGEAGFDYFGGSAEDIDLLDAAAEAVVVAPDRQARRWQAFSGAQLVDDEGSSLVLDALTAMRPHQWVKNILVFVPLALAHAFLNAEMLLAGLVAFFSFSLAASAIYILNDLLDLQSDRRHKTKRFRGFASGVVPIPVGLTLAVVLLCASLLLSLFVDPAFRIVLAGYVAATTLYSFVLKRMLLIDVLTLAGLYTLRIVAGAAAAQVDGSFWLMAFSIFFFLSLALVKRYTELLDVGLCAGLQIPGRGYRDVDLETIGQAGMASGFASVMVLALYIDSVDVRQLYAVPSMLWPLCPLVLYIVVRMWVLARRNQMHEDPVVFVMRDWRSQIMIVAGAVMFVAAAYV